MQSTWRPCGASLPAASCGPARSRTGLSCVLGAPAGVGLPAWRWRRLQTDAARAMPSPPRGWRGPPSPRLTGRSIPAKGEVEPRVKSARPGSQGTCRGRYHTGGPAVAEPVYVLPVAVAGSVGATVRAGRSGAGGCVVGRGVAPLTKGTWPAPRSAFHGALTPLHGAARAAHPAPQPMGRERRPGRALHSHGVAPGSGAAVVGQLCALANPARDWRAGHVGL